jgi:hypothetical protein
VRFGDIYIAGVGAATRERVVVVSELHFNRVSGRAIVARALEPVGGRTPPWRASGFALDYLATISTERLLELDGSLSAAQQHALRKSMRQIIG